LEVGLGRIDEVEAQHEGVVAAAHMKAVAVVVLVRDIAAALQRGPGSGSGGYVSNEKLDH
jgi:hypothetical protein